MADIAGRYGEYCSSNEVGVGKQPSFVMNELNHCRARFVKRVFPRSSGSASPVQPLIGFQPRIHHAGFLVPGRPFASDHGLCGLCAEAASRGPSTKPAPQHCRQAIFFSPQCASGHLSAPRRREKSFMLCRGSGNGKIINLFEIPADVLRRNRRFRIPMYVYLWLCSLRYTAILGQYSVPYRVLTFPIAGPRR
jgi:hypothetical protein